MKIQIIGFFARANRLHDHESAAKSLREGMAEMVTVQRLQPPALAVQMPGDPHRH